MSSQHETDIAFIRELAALLEASDLSELEIKREYGDDDALTVRLSRTPAALPQAAPAYLAPAPLAPPPAPPPAPPAAGAAGAAGPAPEAAAEATDPAQHPGAVASPMVGTVYLQPEPGMDPFVKLGDSVSEGQPLLIIEAMKTMNQIPAPRAGTVRRIMVEDGTAVEFGSPLMIID
ncbi:MAG: acetyl-CoA carboxylase biotin carboxyl carrier protein [Pseudomonadota bacterium]